MNTKSKIDFGKMKRAFFSAFVLLLCASSGIFAQKQTEKRKYIPGPIKKMEMMIGKWEGNVHSETGPVVSSREMIVGFDFSKALNEQAIQLSSTSEIIGQQKKSRGYGIIASDTISNELHMMLLNDSGAVYDLIGKWTNNFSLNFSCNTERNGKKIGITLWLIFKTKDQLDYSMYTSIGEETLISDKGVLARKKRAPIQK